MRDNVLGEVGYSYYSHIERSPNPRKYPILPEVTYLLLGVVGLDPSQFPSNRQLRLTMTQWDIIYSQGSTLQLTITTHERLTKPGESGAQFPPPPSPPTVAFLKRMQSVCSSA